MKGSIVSGWEEELRRRRKEEDLLEARIRRADEDYSGLKDVEDILSLAVMRFSTSLYLLEQVTRVDPSLREDLSRIIGEEVRWGKELLEALLGENLSEGEREAIKERDLYKEAQGLFKKILLSGGAGFFEQDELSAKQRAEVAKTVAASLKKYARPDDDPAILFITENLPQPMRRFLKLFFPTAAPEGMKPPPYGIPEGEEEERTSPYLVMPLSQGILYLQEELLPETEGALKKNPGDPELQGKRRWILDTLSQWKRLTFIPRATPVLLNQDFYTQGLSQYTPEGELLVRFTLPVSYSSGTNLDRYGEQVRGEVVRRLSGRGIVPALDSDLRYRKSLASGRRGNSRTPSFRLDLAGGFRAIKRDIPSLGCLEDKASLDRFLDQARRGSLRSLSRKIKRLIEPGDTPGSDKILT